MLEIHSTPQKTLLQTLNHSKPKSDKYDKKTLELSNNNKSGNTSIDIPHDSFETYSYGEQRFYSGQYPSYVEKIINTQRLPSRSIYDVQKQDAFDRYTDYRQTEHQVFDQLYEKGPVFHASTSMLKRKQEELLTGYNYEVEWLTEEPGDFTMRHALQNNTTSFAVTDYSNEIDSQPVASNQVYIAMEEMGIYDHPQTMQQRGQISQKEKRRKWDRAATIKTSYNRYQSKENEHYDNNHSSYYEGAKVSFPLKKSKSKTKSVNRSNLLKSYATNHNSTNNNGTLLKKSTGKPSWNDDTKTPTLFSAFALTTVKNYEEQQKRLEHSANMIHQRFQRSVSARPQRSQSSQRPASQISSRTKYGLRGETVSARNTSTVTRRPSSAIRPSSATRHTQSQNSKVNQRPSSARIAEKSYNGHVLDKLEKLQYTIDKNNEYSEENSQNEEVHIFVEG